MSTPKHNEMSAILGLKSKHDVKIDAMNKQIFILNGKSKKVSKKDDLGIGSWGKIDFLVNYQGYRKSMVSEF